MPCLMTALRDSACALGPVSGLTSEGLVVIPGALLNRRLPMPGAQWRSGGSWLDHRCGGSVGLAGCLEELRAPTSRLPGGTHSASTWECA